MTPHDFRHTYVSMLIHEGYDDTSIAELIGDSVLTVRTVYAHMLPSRRKDVMVVLDKSIPKEPHFVMILLGKTMKKKLNF